MVRENSNNNSNKFPSPGGNITSGSGDEEMTTTTTRMNNDTNINQKPAWLEGLMGEAFFGGCGDHTGRRKNEKNVFCLLCCLSICPHCLPSHPSHPLLQVRRYVYQDVVRLDDLEKLVDCSYIQPYTINSAKVIFLHQRPQSRPCKGSANFCFTCDRILQEPFHFCSLACKVNQMEDQGEDLSTILYRTDDLSDFAFPQFEGLRMDSSEFIDDDGQTTSSSIVIKEPMLQQYGTGSSCSNEAMGSSAVSHNNEVCNEKKKGSGSGFLPGIVLSLSNRRKGAPHRAPLS